MQINNEMIGVCFYYWSVSIAEAKLKEEHSGIIINNFVFFFI